MACTSRVHLLRKALRNLQIYLLHSYVPEPTMPIHGKCPKMMRKAEEAFVELQSGETVFFQGATATPNVLLTAMAKVAIAKKLQDVCVATLFIEGPALFLQPEFKDIFRPKVFFIGSSTRQAVAEGRCGVIPIFLHETPKLFYRKIVCPDYTLIQVSPPDEHGYCTLGTTVDCVRAALLHSKKIVAQINPKMPRTFGDSLVHVSHIDFAIDIDEPLPTFGDVPPGKVELAIGKLIAENLVDDGATLQMGIGTLPDAVLTLLTNHKDLGIHSEMFSNGVVELMQSGAITNHKKSIYKGRTVGAFLAGSQKLYDFVDNNPNVTMLRVEWVNHPTIIGQMPKMTAINSCIEVDLTGQVASDSIGTFMYSGFGGQVDFIRGAGGALDDKGVPIIAMPSTTSKGESKINVILKEGGGVTCSRAHAQYVVTEYGIASLFGKNYHQRAYELIRIAHPDHQERLEKDAFERFKVMPSC